MMKNGCVINKTWIILDILSIDSVTNNLDYVEDVKNCVKHKELTVLTNGVSLICDRKLRLTFLTLSVHVNKNYLSTILSFKDLKNIPVVQIKMGTLIEKAMNVILRYGTVFDFKECRSGLYYFDMTKHQCSI